MTFDIEKNKAMFMDLASKNIKRPGLEKLLAYLETTDWYTAPASSRFHLAVPGGLVQHSMNVYSCLRALMIAEKIKKKNMAELDETEEETACLVGLFHDACKADTYSIEMRNVKDPKTGEWKKEPFYKFNEKQPLGHGEKSVMILSRYINLLPEEIYAIRWHMGFSDVSFRGGDNSVGRAFEICPLACLTNLADMQATYLDENPKADFMFDTPVLE